MAKKQYIPLINPASTERTLNLFRFIQDIQGQYTLSGQHNFVGKGSEYSDQLEHITERKAVLWGSDFSFCVKGADAMRFVAAGPANLPLPLTEDYRAIMDSIGMGGNGQDPKPFIRKPKFLDITLDEARRLTMDEIKLRHREGHMITMMWHACFPTDGDCCKGSSVWSMEDRPPPEMWNELVTEGTALNDAWKKGTDKVAGCLKELCDANIPVLWRPYHEMNGVWFWWCNQRGESGFKRLWVMMYEYFTHHHGLKNLIWVWNANAPRDIPGDEARAYEDFFPGIEYVDILAADVYRNDYRQSHHDQLVELSQGKPVALGEVGPIPTLQILGQQPMWSWFMPWGWILFHANSEELIREMYRSDCVLTMDQLTVDQMGNYKVNC